MKTDHWKLGYIDAQCADLIQVWIYISLLLVLAIASYLADSYIQSDLQVG